MYKQIDLLLVLLMARYPITSKHICDCDAGEELYLHMHWSPEYIYA